MGSQISYSSRSASWWAEKWSLKVLAQSCPPPSPSMARAIPRLCHVVNLQTRHTHYSQPVTSHKMCKRGGHVVVLYFCTSSHYTGSTPQRVKDFSAYGPPCGTLGTCPVHGLWLILTAASSSCVQFEDAQIRDRDQATAGGRGPCCL